MIFRLFEDIRIIKGYNRASLIDLSIEQILFLPLYFSDLLQEINGINDYKKKLRQNSPELIQFIEDNEIGFECSPEEIDFFPSLNLTWESSSIITSATIEIGNNINLFDVKILEQLGCKHIELHIKNIDNLSLLLRKFEASIMQSITINLSGNIDIKAIQKLTHIITKTPRVVECHIYSEDITQYPVFPNVKYHTNYLSTPRKTKHLTTNMSLFTESQQYHTYFNRKLYIGKDGEIKNALECELDFGGIQSVSNVTELKKIISQPNFQKYWLVHKELCDVCKDCEFRHTCVDSRIPYQRKNKTWYHKEECNYNPYICKWKGEKGYKSLKELDIISNEDGFSINHKIIETINETLWAD